MQRDGPILLDIYHAALRVQRFTAGLPRDRFKEAEETQSAVLYQLIVIGEAVSRLSDEFRTQHPVAPWRKIVGLRNIITHQYDAVDLDEVWTITQRDLPALVAAIRPLLPPREP